MYISQNQLHCRSTSEGIFFTFSPLDIINIVFNLKDNWGILTRKLTTIDSMFWSESAQLQQLSTTPAAVNCCSFSFLAV